MRIKAHPLTDSGIQHQFLAVTGNSKQDKKLSPRVTLRLTEEELERLKKAAAGTSVSSYIRGKLFGKDVSLR